MEALRQWFNQLDFTVLIQLLITVLACLTCITLHECAHGLAALWLGDRTAKASGRLSLNPLRHMDLVGLVMLAVAGFGWAKPVPVNPRNFSHPKLGMALCALAGPLANVLICIVSFLLANLYIYLGLYQFLGSFAYCVLQFFVYVAQLSAGMAVFNLLPVPPLDGSKMLAAFLPDKAYATVLRYERYGMLLLVFLLFTGVLDGVLDTAQQGLLEFASGIGSLLPQFLS